MKKIVVIGGGNMGFTYAESIFNSSLEASIHVIEKSESRIEEIRSLNTISIGKDVQVLKNCDLVLLAIKPQVALAVFKEIKPFLNKNQLIVSIMAGTTISSIQKGLGLDKVVRAMPNLPAQVKLGMTTCVGSSEVSDDEMKLIAAILGVTGEVIFVSSEQQLDRSIGISGSGPGFVFYIMEAIEKSAIEMGFSPEDAKKMVVQTFEGSAKLYKEHSISLEEWMSRVSSKGGTTIAGLNHFQKKEISEEIQKGIEVCVARAFELGRK